MDKWLDEMGLGEVRLNKVSLNKTRLDEDRINLNKILLKWFLIKATETLLRFHRNLVKISVLTESGQGLGKIWAGVIALTARDHTRIDIEFRSSEI